MMKLYLKLNLFVLSFLLTQFGVAQDGIISGRLQDQNQETIPFVTVSVMKLPDSTVVTGTTTDLDGNYKLKPSQPGEYVLRFSAIGYTESFTPTFQVIGADFTKDFGISTLHEEITGLKEVTINTWKPRIRIESDKLVMTVENTALAAGNTAFEMLSRAPGVSVGHSGGFLINGKEGVSVMIDGRLTYFSPNELKTFLESMPAENIQEIEVIHNPSAKYDAEGVAGILNITLKQNTSTGLTGSVYGGFQHNQQQLFNGGLNLYHNSGKWNSFATLDLAQRGSVRDQHQYRTFAGEEDNAFLDQEGTEKSESFVTTAQAGTDYNINDNHKVGISTNLTLEDRENDWNTMTTIGQSNSGGTMDIEARNHIDGNSGHGRLNLYYTGKLDTVGTTLSADLDYVRLERELDSRFDNHYTFLADGSEELESLTNNSISDYDIYAAKVDLRLPLSRSSNLEMGVKGSKVISNSELRFFTEENGSPIFDPTRSDRFRYEEEIYAAYSTYSNRINSTWNVQAGLRAEQTYGKGRSFVLDQITPTEYIEFFPTLLVEQNVNDNYNLAYSFTRRISRPNYVILNPFISYLDPYTYIVGNPDIKPQFTSSLQFSQTLFKKYNLRLAYDFSRDYMGEVPSMVPETRETTFTTRNMDNYIAYGATLVAPIEIANFWNVNNTLVFNREQYDLEINGEPIETKDYFFMAQSNHQVSLPWDVQMELNATYRSSNSFGVYAIGQRWWMDAGLKKSFIDDRLNVSLRATDIFKTLKTNVEADFLGNHYELQQYFGHQSISINLRYNFSNGNSKRETRSNSLEEMSRAGAN